jgi:hypothetical protein
MPTIKASYILMAAVVAPLVMSRPAMNQQSATMAPVVDFKKQEQIERRASAAQASEARKDSRVALDRVRLLCTPVLPVGTEVASVLAEGGKAIDEASGQDLVEGSLVCTARGSTAMVGQGGVTTDVRNVNREDFPEYLDNFNQQTGEEQQ